MSKMMDQYDKLKKRNNGNYFANRERNPRGDHMGLFDVFKRGQQTPPPIAHTCARCKKEITDEETEWIGNHRFCVNCAAPPKKSTINKHLEDEAKEAGYQAHMDYARGSLTPDQAYANRGFVKDKDGKWVYGKLVISNTVKPYKKTIHSAGTHVAGALYEEVTIEMREGKHCYTTLSMTDKYNTGGHSGEIPKDFIIDGMPDAQLLLDYIAVKHPYMESLSHRRNSARLCYICKMPLNENTSHQINTHLLCEDCHRKINDKHQ